MTCTAAVHASPVTSCPAAVRVSSGSPACYPAGSSSARVRGLQPISAAAGPGRPCALTPVHSSPQPPQSPARPSGRRPSRRRPSRPQRGPRQPPPRAPLGPDGPGPGDPGLGFAIRGAWQALGAGQGVAAAATESLHGPGPLGAAPRGPRRRSRPPVSPCTAGPRSGALHPTGPAPHAAVTRRGSAAPSADSDSRLG